MSAGAIQTRPVVGLPAIPRQRSHASDPTPATPRQQLPAGSFPSAAPRRCELSSHTAMHLISALPIRIRCSPSSLRCRANPILNGVCADACGAHPVTAAGQMPTAHSGRVRTIASGGGYAITAAATALRGTGVPAVTSSYAPKDAAAMGSVSTGLAHAIGAGEETTALVTAAIPTTVHPAIGGARASRGMAARIAQRGCATAGVARRSGVGSASPVSASAIRAGEARRASSWAALVTAASTNLRREAAAPAGDACASRAGVASIVPNTAVWGLLRRWPHC